MRTWSKKRNYENEHHRRQRAADEGWPVETEEAIHQALLPLYGRHNCRYIWQALLSLYGRHYCHYMAGITVAIWQALLSLYGRHNCHDMAGITVTMWKSLKRVPRIWGPRDVENKIIVRASVRPSVRLSVYPSVHLSICPSVCPFIYPSVRLSVYPSVRPFVCFDPKGRGAPSISGPNLLIRQALLRGISILLLCAESV